MLISIANKIIRGLFTVLIILNGSLATNVLVSATSSTRPSSEQQTGNAPRDHEGGPEIAVDDRPLSPRLAKLQDQLKAGNRKALDSFWKEIAERGAPIIEGVPENDRDMLVTMLWRATEEW